MTQDGAPLQVPADSPGPGAVLDGRYELQRELGRGAMGRVFKARDLEIGRDVAIKLLSSSRGSLSALERFAREGKTAASLNHPHLVTIHELGNSNGTPYLVMELLEGQPLSDKIRVGPLPLEEALELALGVARGIAYAHERGVIHRDLKPDNLFVLKDGWIKILDFGISKIVTPERTSAETDGTDETPLTREHTFLGTAGYAAPEQVMGGAIDARTDLFSLGVVLYEMVSGARAFHGRTRDTTLGKVLREAPPPLPPSVPRAVRDIIDKCLRKDREDRYRTAREVSTALSLVLNGARTAVAGRKLAMRPRAALLAAPVFAAMVGLGLWYFFVREPASAVNRLQQAADEETRSRSARAAFRDGEQAMRQGRSADAAAAFQRAAALDPDFALASYRLAVVSTPNEPGVARDALERALRSTANVTPRDRALIEALSAYHQGRVNEAERLYRAILAEHGDDVEAWARLGDLLSNYATLLGRSLLDAYDARSHEIILAPGETHSLPGLIDLAQMQGQRALARNLAERYLAQRDQSSPVQLEFRWAAAWNADDVAQRARVLGDAVTSGDMSAQQDLFLRAAFADPKGEDAEQLAQRLSTEGSPARQSMWTAALGILAIARGEIDEARRLLSAAVQLNRGGMVLYEAAWLESLDFIQANPAQIALARARLREINVASAPPLAAMRYHLEGVLAARNGDFPAAEEAARHLEMLPPLEGSSVTTDLALAVRAHVLAAQSKTDDALARLEQMSLRVTVQQAGGDFTRLSEQRLRSRLLAAKGRWAEAERWEVLGISGPFELALTPAIHLRLAELADRRGDPIAASVHAAQVRSRWGHPDPALAGALLPWKTAAQ